MKQFFEEVADSVRGGHVHTGARLGGLTVLLILIIGAIDQSAGMPRNVYRQSAQASGAACEMNSFSTGSSIAVETPATEMQKKTCTPISCFQTAEGGTKCMVKPAAQALSGGAGGLMEAIGGVLQGLMKGGGGGGGGGSGYTPPADVTKAPKCTTLVASSGTSPIKPKEEVTLSWVLSGGTPEEYAYSAGFPPVSGYTTSVTVSPERSTTYTLTVKNSAGSSTCSARVYVGPAGYSDVGGDTQTDEATTDTLTTANGNDGVALADPLTGETTTNTVANNTPYSDTGTGASNNLGYVASRGVKTNIVADDKAFVEDKKAFVEDKNALKEDKNAFIIEDLASDADFDALAKDLGSDGIYSKEDIATLERASREAQARKNVRVRAAIDDVSHLTPSEVQGLWNRPGEGRTGSLTENIYDEYDPSDTTTKDSSLFNRFGTWLKETFCFWCTVERVSINSVAILASIGSSATDPVTPPPSITGTPGPTPTSAEKKPEAAAPKPPDNGVAKCLAEHKQQRTNICSKQKTLRAAKECEKAYDEYTPGSPFATGYRVPVEENPAPKQATQPNTPIPCKAPPQGCEICKELGASKPPKEAAEAIKNKRSCNTGFVCRDDIKAEKPKTEVSEGCKKDPKTCTPEEKKALEEAKGKDGSGGNGAQSGGSGDQGSGQQGGQGSGQQQGGQGSGDGSGLGEIGKAIGEMMKGAGNKDQQQQQPWWEQPQDKVTEAPKCVEDKKPEPAQIITRGETATLNWTVTGKGTIKMVVNFVTKDASNKSASGTLGVVDSGMAEVSPEYTTIYKLKATNEIGTVTCKPIKVIVKPPVEDDGSTTASGDVDLVCDPGSIQKNDPAAIVWSCPNTATSSLGTSTEDGLFNTNGRTEGSYEAKPLRDATYVVRCRDKFDKEVGRNSCTVTVKDTGSTDTTTTTGTSRPKVEISAEPPSAPQGSSVTIRWKSNAETAACVVYGPGCDTYGKDSEKCLKEVGRSGFITGLLYEASTFRAECIGVDRKTSVSDSVKVDVTASGDELQSADAGE